MQSLVSILFLVAPFFAFSVMGQTVSEPGWYGRLETALTESKPEMTVQLRSKRFDGISASMVFRIDIGNEGGNIELFWPGFSDIANASENFRGSKIIYSRGAATGTLESEIKDFGDEAALWTDSAKKSWKKLHFRRDKAIVQISGTSETFIRRLAALIDSEIKKG